MRFFTPMRHYDCCQVESLADVRELLPAGADPLNWIFLSTDGVHGDTHTLDRLERSLTDEPERPQSITVLIVRPRLVSVRWGHVRVSDLREVQWLRRQVETTLRCVAASQVGNLPYSPEA